MKRSRCESQASSRSSNYPTSDLQMQRFSCLESLWHPCGISIEHERTVERNKGWACRGLEFFLLCESETVWREDKQQKRKKKPWAGRFKAASQSCWSGGSASVWSGFSPAGAAEQHASSSSSSCYPTFSSVTSLPYGPSPPLPLTHLCAEGRGISTCDIPTQERGRAREIEKDRKKERRKNTLKVHTDKRKCRNFYSVAQSGQNISSHMFLVCGGDKVAMGNAFWEIWREFLFQVKLCFVFYVKVTVKCWVIYNRSDSSALLLEMLKWSKFCWCNLQLTWFPLMPSNLFTSVYLDCNYPGKMSIIRILIYNAISG